MIQVTKPFLPPSSEYKELLDGVWERNWLTNNGPLVQQLEAELKEFLGVSHVHFVTNGTIALQLAIKALDLHGEIITTPFSYVATTSSIVWENTTPVFADIDPLTLNIDPKEVEKRITPKTTAILAAHVYGIPCAVEDLKAIANKNGLKIIYDGAHAFGARLNGKSLLNWGDISTCSFHATKLFHTIEGGGVFTANPEIHERLGFLKNFGHHGFDKYAMLGVNGKNSEFHAAMGIVNMRYVKGLIQKRAMIAGWYDKKLLNLNLQRPSVPEGCEYNYAYYPVIFNTETSLLQAFQFLQKNQVFARRYFYPSLEKLPYIKHEPYCNVAEDYSRRILCLPFYDSLKEEEVSRICRLIMESQTISTC